MKFIFTNTNQLIPDLRTITVDISAGQIVFTVQNEANEVIGTTIFERPQADGIINVLAAAIQQKEI